MRPKKETAPEIKVPIGGLNIKRNLLIPGLFDILTSTQSYQDIILKRFLVQAKIYGFDRLETPPLEDTQIYKIFYGQDSKMLEKLVYFEAGNRSLALRPELLPSVLRAYVQHKVYELEVSSKWMYFGSVLTLGPKQQFISDYQLGVEVFGSFSHLTEAQAISSFWHLFKSLGLDVLTLEINHIGSPACQRSYQSALGNYLVGKKYDLCDNCIEYLNNDSLNVMRCQNLDCRTVVSEAPTILDFLEEESRSHFTSILEALDEIEIPYQLNPYYVGAEGGGRTNARITYQPKESSEKIVLAEGTYHDLLMQRLSGKSWCSFGIVSNMSTIIKAMELTSIVVERERKSEVCLVPLGDLATRKALRLFRDLIAAKVVVFDQFGDTGVKNQLKLAQDYKTPIALIMGQKEAVDETVILRDVKSGMQEMFSYDKIIDEVKKRLGK